MIDLKNLTIQKAHDALASGEYSVHELVDAYRAVITEKNTDINAYIEVFVDDEAITRAQEMFTNGTATMLTGIPFAIKDNILINGKTASAGSNILKPYTATYDATVITLLKAQGAIFLGRTNMDECAMGSSTETSTYGPTKNPIDTSRVPGGSSGGSVAAVAMNGALVALGSDTGGSIRQPAAYTGLVGMKPTYGVVSRYGLIAMSSSLDAIGPITKTVAEAKIVFDALAQYDEHDATSVEEGARRTARTLGKKIGVPMKFALSESIGADVRENFLAAIETMKSAGYEIVDIDLPLSPHSLAVYYILMPAESSTNLSRFDGIRYGLSHSGKELFDTYADSRADGFGAEVRRRILLGTYVLSHGYYDAYYKKADALRRAITLEFRNAFETVDFIMTPTAPSVAFPFGAKKDPMSMYLSDIFTVPANIAGLPAIAVPSGVGEGGMPLSVQFTAPHFAENDMFRVAEDFETLCQQ
jgi:aspartyl-tRNA(Asn)/glutamyl-tRNA(Gln) amidotransferase subunit A